MAFLPTPGISDNFDSLEASSGTILMEKNRGERSLTGSCIYLDVWSEVGHTTGDNHGTFRKWSLVTGRVSQSEGRVGGFIAWPYVLEFLLL